MTISLLLDLDDTLLETNIEAFLPAYYGALAEYLKPRVPPPDLLSALRSGVQLMLDNDDPSRTLQQVFESHFYGRLSVAQDTLQAAIHEFYAVVFPTLRNYTRVREDARAFVEWALAQGHQVSIATDPVFPRAAVLERIRWAGLDPAQFALVSSFETFHFTKSRPAFFAEFIGQLGWPDRAVLMAGNDIERDLRPAEVLGLDTFHVNGALNGTASSSAQSLPAASGREQGDLRALQAWLQSVNLKPYEPTFITREAVLAVLEATPAALQSMAKDLDPVTWTTEPSRDDWALIELVCHLRDTEREVHHVQIDALLAESDPFVPRPDAAVWAKQRKYLDEDGPGALRDLALARLETLRRLRQLPEEAWSKPARHAIFGPTNFREVISFMGDHDRMHVQQAWNTLAALDRVPHRN